MLASLLVEVEILVPLHRRQTGVLNGFDAYINLKTNQIFVTISQKNRYLLDLVCSVYGGKVYSNNANKSAYK